MKLVKTNERIPETSGFYYCKTFAHTKELFWFNKELNGAESLFKRDIAEWLDESPDPIPSDWPVTINEVCDIIHNSCQLLNGIKPDAVNEKWWSDWDESVLQSLIELLKKLQPLYVRK